MWIFYIEKMGIIGCSISIIQLTNHSFRDDIICFIFQVLYILVICLIYLFNIFYQSRKHLHLIKMIPLTKSMHIYKETNKV